MATTKNTAFSSSILTDLFPVIGSRQRAAGIPIWMPSMRIFKVSEYRSSAGHLYFKGLRYSENLAVAFTFSFWNTLTYLNEIEVYRFSSNKIELVDCRTYGKQFYDESFIKDEVKQIVRSVLEASLALSREGRGFIISEDQITDLVEGTYRPLSDYDLDKLENYVKCSVSRR